MNRQQLGRQAEDAAWRFLETKGLRLVDRNYRCRGGEIDLVMRDGQTLVFVEVRFRRSEVYGGAVASVDARKSQRLLTAARHYLQAHAPRDNARIDVIAINGRHHCEWIRNAVEA